MKGQFFIIATVIIISALIMMIQYFYDYGRSDLTIVQEMKETDYIAMVRDSLLTTAKASLLGSNCNIERLDADMEDAKNYLKDKLIEKGILLDIEYSHSAFTVDILPPPVCYRIVDISFNLTTTNYFSQTSSSILV